MRHFTNKTVRLIIEVVKCINGNLMFIKITVGILSIFISVRSTRCSQLILRYVVTIRKDRGGRET